MPAGEVLTRHSSVPPVRGAEADEVHTESKSIGLTRNPRVRTSSSSPQPMRPYGKSKSPEHSGNREYAMLERRPTPGSDEAQRRELEAMEARKRDEHLGDHYKRIQEVLKTRSEDAGLIFTDAAHAAGLNP